MGCVLDKRVRPLLIWIICRALSEVVQYMVLVRSGEEDATAVTGADLSF